MAKKTVGQYLKKKRLQKGYTMNHACLLADVSYSTLGHWENDAVQEIRFEPLHKLLTVYGIKPVDFVANTRCSLDLNKVVMEI